MGSERANGLNSRPIMRSREPVGSIGESAEHEVRRGEGRKGEAETGKGVINAETNTPNN